MSVVDDWPLQASACLGGVPVQTLRDLAGLVVAVRHEPVALVLTVEADPLRPEASPDRSFEQCDDPPVTLVRSGHFQEFDVFDVAVDH